MPGVARLGDKTNHGGTVVSASSTVVADGKPVARAGDMHVCPIKGHGTTPFSSSSSVVEGGRGLVRAGMDAAGCGAVVVGGSPTVNAS